MKLFKISKDAPNAKGQNITGVFFILEAIVILLGFLIWIKMHFFP